MTQRPPKEGSSGLPDQTASLIRILGGLAASANPVFVFAAEAVASLIPGQKVDRIESILRSLDRRLSRNAQAVARLEELSDNPELLDLLEDVLVQSSRALSEERLEHLATFLDHALSAEQLEHGRRKKLLQILGELADEELLILRFHMLIGPGGEHRAFFRQHRELLEPASERVSASPEEVARGALQLSFKRCLVNHGLLREKALLTENPLRELEITPLGKMLLAEIWDDA